jgi:hypothetical protein
MNLVLDTTVLGALCHPRKGGAVKLWYRGMLGFGRATIYLPES